MDCAGALRCDCACSSVSHMIVSIVFCHQIGTSHALHSCLATSRKIAARQNKSIAGSSAQTTIRKVFSQWSCQPAELLPKDDMIMPLTLAYRTRPSCPSCPGGGPVGRCPLRDLCGHAAAHLCGCDCPRRPCAVCLSCCAGGWATCAVVQSRLLRQHNTPPKFATQQSPLPLPSGPCLLDAIRLWRQGSVLLQRYATLLSSTCNMPVP